MRFLVILCFVFSASAWAQPCGLEGSTEERIKSCNLTKGDFVLIARSASGVEIFKDSKSGLIWGDRITSDFNHYGSAKACDDSIPEAEMLKEIKWRLPTVRDFEEAAIRGMKTSLSRMHYHFWTSTQIKQRTGRRRRIVLQSLLWDGNAEKTDVADAKDAASVRCVGKISKD